MRRHYLHGDPIEGHTGLYYCKAHDAFEPAAHFEVCTLGIMFRRGVRYRETHEWRYVTARRLALKPDVVAARKRSGLRAIDDPGNLFRTGPMTRQRLPALTPA